MCSPTIDVPAVRSSLSKMSPSNHPYNLIKCYAAIKEVEKIMSVSSWKYPHAAFRHTENLERISKKLDSAWTEDYFHSVSYRDDFQMIYDMLQPLSLREFMKMIIPDFIAQYDRTFEILDSVNDIGDQCLLLIWSKEKWRHEQHQPELIEEIPLRRIEHLIPITAWTTLVYSVNCYAFDYQSKVKGEARKAVVVFNKYLCPKEYQIALYGQVREKLVGTWEGKNSRWEKYITDGAHYIKKTNQQDPQIDALNMDAAINEAAHHIGKIERPSDFLEAVLVSEKNDDSKLENDFVFSKFVERLTEDDKILLVNPSIDFLLKYPAQYLSRTRVCVPSKPLAWVLEHEFPAKFSSIEELFYEESAGPDEEIDEKCYSKILLFSRDLSKGTVNRLMVSVLIRKKPGGEFYALLPSTSVVSLHPCATELDILWWIRSIDLLPQKSTRSSPRKKVFICAVTEETPEVQMTSYDFFQGVDQKSYLKKQYETPLCVDAESFYTVKSIYQLYQDCIRKQPEVQRKPPMSYPFTPEIYFWYTISKSPKTFGPKVEAYVCSYATRKQAKRRLFMRGNKIKDAYASTSKHQIEQIEDWCENTLPYKPRIHKAVVTAFKKAAGDAPALSRGISLQTFWYLQIDIEKWDKYPQADAEKRLFSSDVGAVRLPDIDDSDDSALMESMEAFCTDKSQAEQTNYWNILNRVLNLAVQNHYVYHNPAEAVAQNFREKDAGTQDVRQALVKKTFRLDEERKLLEFLNRKLPQEGEYLSVLIRFFTGLEPNLVAALTWNDLHTVKEANIEQLWIYRQFCNDGTQEISFEHNEDFRRIPVANMLKETLDARREYVQTFLHVDEKALGGYQIIAPNHHLTGLKTQIITPWKINDLSRKAVRSIGIPEIVVSLPDKANGTKETNLTSYHGDIFRTNFRYQSNYTCGFTESEIRYILGLRQISTFGQNYCDYLNNFSQLIMYQKLCRWDAVLRADDHSPACSVHPLRSAKVTLPPMEETMTAVIDLRLDQTCAQVEITAECDGGVYGRLDFIEPVNEEEKDG